MDNKLGLIFLDAAMTLIRPEPGVGALYAQIAREHGVEVDGAALEAHFGAAWVAGRAAAAPAPPYGRTWPDAVAFWKPVVESTFAAAGAAMPADPYIDDVFEAFSTGRAWALYDDVAPALELAARRGVRVGLLSNFDVRLHRLLDEFGLREALDPIVVSADLGVEKPHPGIYEHAARAAGLPPGRLGMIGDSPAEDHDGPIAAGWRAVLVDRRGPRDDGRAWAASLVEAVERLLA